MMMHELIHIALPSDQNYFSGLLVTVYSIAKSCARQDVRLVFHVLDGGISDDSFAMMGRAVKRVHANSRFVRHMVSEQDFSLFPSFHGNRMTYVRYLLPMLVQEDFVVYADSDCLWLTDVAELWDLRDSNAILKAVYDAPGERMETAWFAAHGLPLLPGRYFCNGLLLMNLKLFRSEKIVHRAVEFTAKHPDIGLADQTVFNAILGARVELLPGHYNVFTRTIGTRDVNMPVVLHYAGQLPWKDRSRIDRLSPFKALWHEIYDEASERTQSEVFRQLDKCLMRMIAVALNVSLRSRITRWPLFAFLKLLRADALITSMRAYIGNTGRILIK